MSRQDVNQKVIKIKKAFKTDNVLKAFFMHIRQNI